MVQEQVIQPGIELTVVAINPTLNKEQNIFMATDTTTAKVVENTTVGPAQAETNTSTTSPKTATAKDSSQVLQAFVDDELTPDILKEHARREIEKMRVEQNADLRAKWEKAKREAKKGTITDKSIAAAIAKGHAPEDVTSKGLLKITAKEVVENSNINEESEMDPKEAKALLDKEVLTPREQTHLLMAHRKRLEEAEKVLGGKKLNVEQKLAILKAHYVGLGEEGEDGNEAGVYNLKQEQVAEKARILEQAGLNKDQRREIIESGLTAMGGMPPGGLPRRNYIGERNAAIVDLGTINFGHPELDSIKQKIIDLHTHALLLDPAGPGIDSESLGGFFEQWANANKSGRLLAADALLARDFQEKIRNIAQLDGYARGHGGSEEKFVNVITDYDIEIAEAIRSGNAARETDLRRQRRETIANYVGTVNVFETGLHDPTLAIIAQDNAQFKRLAFKVVGKPLRAETGDYSLGFYGQINLDAMTNLLTSLSENEAVDATRERYSGLNEDINNISEGVRTMHELNKYIITGRLEPAGQMADSVQPKYQNVLQKWKGVALVERLLETAHSAVTSRDGYINVDSDQEMMGSKINKVTGEFETGQTKSVLAEFRELIRKVKADPRLAVGSLSGLQDIEEWEISLAYSLGRALFNNQQRKAMWTSQGQVPAGNRAWESTPLEGFNKIFNPAAWLYHRFTIGKGRGGMRWFEMFTDAMQRYKHTEGWGHTGITKIRDTDIKFFELPTMTGVRDWMASWRAIGMTLRQTDARFNLQGEVSGFQIFHKDAGSDKIPVTPADTSLGILLDTGSLAFKTPDGKDKTFEELSDQAKADYFRSVFYEPNTNNLRADLQSALGVMYRYSLNPSAGHHASEKEAKFNAIKEEIRAKIWERVAEDNPLAIIPYLNRMEYTHKGKTHKTFGGKNILRESFVDHAGRTISVDWLALQRKLNFLNEIKLAKVRGVKDASGHYIPGQEPVLNYRLQDAINYVGHNYLTLDEERFLAEVRHEGHEAAHEMANVKFAFAPFINDVNLEATDYDQPGQESFARHFRDMGHFNGTNGAIAKAMDNMGTINDYHKMVEFIGKFMEGITSVHGDDTAKHKAYPVTEATMAFFRRGENAGGKFVPEEKRSIGSKLKRYLRQWDEVHAVLQSGHKANSIAQQYYNVEALALDRHQTFLAMEELVANGLMGHDQEEEVKKRFSGFIPFIWRMILESFLRTAKISSFMTAKNLLGSSFKGAVE